MEQSHVPVISPSLSGPEIFTSISKEGRVELGRPLASLWWSAVVAGIAISLSFVCKGFLHAWIPDAPWRGAVTSIGYTVGFVVVTLGRLQLFTENTITTVLPALEDRSWRTFVCSTRLWVVVLFGNLLGCFVAALLTTFGELAPPPQQLATMEVALHYADRNLGQMFTHGIPAGFLVAAMVWSSPAAGSSRFWVTFLLSYMISAGNLTHVVAGSTELFTLMLDDRLSVIRTFGSIFCTGAGNILGGTVFFAILAYAQAREELPDEPKHGTKQE